MLVHVLANNVQREYKSFALEFVNDDVDSEARLFYMRGHRLHFVEMDLAEFAAQLSRRMVQLAPPSNNGNADGNGHGNGIAPVAGPSAPTVFLCHAHEDAAIAEQVTHGLRANSITVWLDKDALEAGDAWDQIIEQRIQDVNYFVVLQSEHLQNKQVGYVNKELALARDRQRYYRSPRRFLIPAIVDRPESMLRELDELLVFDQFEELFTLGWSDADRTAFIEQFGEVVRRHRVSPDDQPVGAADLPAPSVKITLLIREDFLGQLETLAVQVPQIMQRRFRLDGLSPDQAIAAIREPASIDDPRLRTERFTYSAGAAGAILEFLRAEESPLGSTSRAIDPSQLQIICQHIERSILPRKAASGGTLIEITESDLGGKEGLDRIVGDFYRRQIESFPQDLPSLRRRNPRVRRTRTCRRGGR